MLLDNVYETLVKATPAGEISPGLATLEISEDGLTYTLTLQEGVTFHDGDPLTASDVVWTLERGSRRDRRRGGDAEQRRDRRGARRPDRRAHADRAGQRPRLQPVAAAPAPCSTRAPPTWRRRPTAPVRSRSASGARARSSRSLRNDAYWGEPARRRRGRVPVLHRSQRRRQRAARRRRRPDHRCRLRADRPVRGQPGLRHHQQSDQRRGHARVQQHRRGAVRPARAPGDHPGDRQAGRARPEQRLRHDHRRAGPADRSVVRGPHRAVSRTIRTPPGRCSRRPATATAWS